jgi:predicted ATPase
MAEAVAIRTPDQRVRVFVSSTLQELASERQAVRDAVTRLRLVPVMFELGARPHPPRQVYRAYLAQSQVFIGVYWQSYGWVGPGEQTSGLEDEYLLSEGLPRLIYVKSPAPQREPRLTAMLNRIKNKAGLSYQHFTEAAELQGLVENDLAVLLSERFEMVPARVRADTPDAMTGKEASAPPALPVALTPLIGRDQEAAAVEDLVVAEGVRLITLTGPGGVGKSRLAVEAARRLEPVFQDGVRFADLSSVSAAGLVADAIAAALPVNTSGARLTGDVESYLRARRLLLVLDNFEQVMAAAVLVAELLAAAPGLVALVTSRTVLRLRGEHEFPVPVLAVPGAGAAASTVVEGRYAAVRLFAERAHAVAPGFELTSANAAAVAEICRRLDGLPLAIELAAAKTRLLPPQALLARLGDTMGLLTGGARDLPARQRTLRNTLDWSFGLLSPGEQALFARLAVFVGTFDLTALEAVGGNVSAPSAADPDPAPQVIDTLGSLVDNSLVTGQTRDGEPRFGLLGTIRVFAQERLHASEDEWRDAHDRHAAYFAALAEPDESELRGPGQLTWLRRLEREHGNLVAMMSWQVEQDHLDTAVHLVWATWRFWYLQGHADDLTRLANDVLAKSARLAPYEHALALAAGGFGRFTDGDQDGAQSFFEQSLPLLRQAGDKVRAALTAGVLGHLLALRHQDGAAASMLDESQTLLRELDNYELTGSDRVQHELNVAYVYNFLGQIRLSQGDNQGAAELFTQALSAARRAQDRITILLSLYDLGVSSQAQGDLAGAVTYLGEGLSLAAEAGDETSAAYYLERLAVIASDQDEAQRAVCLLAASCALLEAKGSGWLHAFLPGESHADEALAALRSRLGGPAFQAAWAYGRSMTGKRAVEYALNNGQASTPGHDSSKPDPA